MAKTLFACEKHMVHLVVHCLRRPKKHAREEQFFKSSSNIDVGRGNTSCLVGSVVGAHDPKVVGIYSTCQGGAHYHSPPKYGVGVLGPCYMGILEGLWGYHVGYL